ncbi:MAG: serine/threonine-protein kinase, partial [Rubricoccaceae bacterium]|nr:serine/threonine-protein kinase [Rubricoccaceae bacterium]
AEARGLGLEARLSLFEEVCAAVAYAHRHLVVHRDLKPSNILVGEGGGGAPQVKLLDFGVARLLEGEPEGAPRTRPEQRILTPEYAAPEQLDGAAVTTATDVYALGVVLHELLVGRRPERPATRPSAAAPAPLRRPLRGDLDTLVLTALHPDPARRYASAEALLDDLRRYRDGRPLAARPDSPLYRARKFVARNRVGVAAAAAVLALLLAALVVVALQQQQTARALADAEATADVLEGLFAATDPFQAERLDTLRVRELLDVSEERLRRELAGQPHVLGRVLLMLGRVQVETGHPDAGEPLLREAAALLADAPPERHADALSALAALHILRAEPREAERLARDALALLPDDADPLVRAAAETQLAVAFQLYNRQEEALPMHRATFERLRNALGEDHDATLRTERLLGDVLFELGRSDEAGAHYRSILERMRRLDGGPHPRQQNTMSALSLLLRMTGREAEAVEVSGESVRLAREAAPGSSRLANALASHAGSLLRLGRLDEAERLLEEATQLPVRRPADRALPLGLLATVHRARGALGQAAAVQREAWDVLRSALGAQHEITIHSALKLGAILQEQARPAEAEAVLLATYEATAPAHGADAPVTRRVGDALAALYEATGQGARAARYRPASARPG